jgi:hypothetical protein
MAAGTISSILAFGEEITCQTNDGLNFYYGTNKGNVYKYVISAGTLTTLANVGGNVLSMSLYSSWLYIGMSGGKLIGVTIS